MHLLSPSILFSLFLVGAVAPGIHKGDRCFRNENVIRTEDIKALAEDFKTPSFERYNMPHFYARDWHRNTVTLCIINKYWAHATWITNTQVAEALEHILECCEDGQEFCGGGYHQVKPSKVYLDVETKVGEECGPWDF
ncbi:MAG: hypothetical protein Q9221_003651 [Calogaya cf. arnoldii]